MNVGTKGPTSLPTGKRTLRREVRHGMRLAALLLIATAALTPGAGAAPGGYPRIANLWGCSPATKEYDRWAGYDLLVMAGGSPGAWAEFRREMRKRGANPILLGTAPLMNLGSPKSTPWMQDAWFLRRPNGEKISWWADQIYTPNLLLDPCLDALVGQTEKAFGDLLRAGSVDGLFYDSVVGSATWLGAVDTDGDGKADVPGEVNPRWHERQCRFLDRVRALRPAPLILANDVDPEHAPHLNGRLFEGGPLLDRVASGAMAASDAIKALDSWMATSAQPGMTFAIMTHPMGWEGWRVGRGNKVTTPGEVERARREFGRMRLGLCTTLMTDAYYAYDFGTVWYGLPYWYAEYDAPLGAPLGPAREVFEVPPVTVFRWSAGAKADGWAIDAASRITPAGVEGGVADPKSNWCRLFATDPRKVPLEPGKTYRIAAVCEVVRPATGTFQFNVRTGKGGWEHHDKGVRPHAGKAGETWSIEATIVPDDFDDYAVEWHLLGAGTLRVKRLEITLLNQCYYRRDFEGGVVLLNALPAPVTVALKEPLWRLKDDAAPLHVVEVDDSSADCTCRGAWESIGGEVHACGGAYRQARKPGEVATWSFKAPSTDTYTLFVTLPGGKRLTEAAAYEVRSRSGVQHQLLDQRKGDGGWVELCQVRLARGERCEVALRSSGSGATAADAIRAESSDRLNDGSRVTSVTLPPLDGTALLKERPTGR